MPTKKRRWLRLIATPLAMTLAVVWVPTARGGYVNFEASHVHPVALTPSGGRLLAVNTPDALLEVFAVQPDGSLVPESSIPVGLEPVSVRARSDTEAWVVNNLSDTVSIVDLSAGVSSQTLFVGDEPTDVVFVGTRAFVSVSQEDVVKVYNLTNLQGAPGAVHLLGRDIRSLAVSADGLKVYAVVLRSGNRTATVGVHATFPPAGLNLDPTRLGNMNLRDIECVGPPPSYPPLPPGVVRNPALLEPPDGIPKVGLIIRWDELAGQWRDEIDQDWSHCLPYTLADHDLFIIQVAGLAVTEVAHLGTTLFEVSVNPGNGKIYVPNTDARNFIRFEHPLGVQGHMVDNRLAVVDPANGNAVTMIDLNTHIDYGSDPSTNLAERQASISQPGMMVWKDGNTGYLTAIGSRKLFRVDGSCLAGGCIFGADRASPDAVEVGEGPTGVAFRDAVQPEDERLYVLNRISHSIAIVQASSMTKLDEIALHDPSSDNTRQGRRFLYDAIDTSGHGDAACSSCHISGDQDGLAWDLGNPPGDLVSYDNLLDNVRFIVPQGGAPAPCDDPLCHDQDGFDPQKGPMTTQTLRGMLEPLHWRGDRPTMNAFNGAFPGLMGTPDIGTPTSPAGISAANMELFRQFALEMAFPPNPYRNVDDTTTCPPRSEDPLCEVLVHGSLFAGNPTEGALLFDNELSDSGQPCKGCHSHPFGAAGGQLGGVAPTEPTSLNTAALFFGTADGSPHSDLKVPHLRNLYDKFGPVWADPGDASMPPTKTGFGHIHDGSVPDIFRFLSASVFTLNTQEVQDLTSFLFHFPTGTKPAVGRQVTLPEGLPPTGPPADEALLGSLIALGDLSDANRHCELVASARAGDRLHHYHLSGALWTTDVFGEPQVTTQVLRENAQSPVTFTCATIGSGGRLGGDRDEDAVLNGDDCAPGDDTTWAAPSTVSGVILDGAGILSWNDQSPSSGPSIRYDVLGGMLSQLHSIGIAATTCLEGGLPSASYDDPQPDPASGDGAYYLVRAGNGCGVAGLGPGRESLDGLLCPLP